MSETHCTCGRFIKTHCPSCGSFGVYARPTAAVNVILDGGAIARNMNYVCRRCGNEFFDSDRASCKATPSNETGRGLSLLDKRMSQINKIIPAERVQATAEGIIRLRAERKAKEDEEKRKRGELS